MWIIYLYLFNLAVSLKLSKFSASKNFEHFLFENIYYLLKTCFYCNMIFIELSVIMLCFTTSFFTFEEFLNFEIGLQHCYIRQGILKREVSRYSWPPVWLVWIIANKNKIVSSHTANSKPVKQEVNSTVILPPLIFPVLVFKEFTFLEKNSTIFVI